MIEALPYSLFAIIKFQSNCIHSPSKTLTRLPSSPFLVAADKSLVVMGSVQHPKFIKKKRLQDHTNRVMAALTVFTRFLNGKGKDILLASIIEVLMIIL